MAVIQGDADQPLAAEQVSDLLVESRGSIPPAPAVIEPKILTAAKGSSIVFASAVIVQALRFAKGFVLARLLASQEYGQYRLALTVATITASLVLLGLESALVRYVALFASRRDTRGISQPL